MLKKAVQQGRSAEVNPRFTFYASRFTVPGSDARTMLADFFSILLEISCLDHIIEAVDVEPVTCCIEYPDGILPFQQFLEQLGNTGLAVGWLGEYLRNDASDECGRAG